MRTTSPQAAQAGLGAIAYNLAGIALIVMLLATGFAYLVDRAGKDVPATAPNLNAAATVVQTIGGRDLTIPTSWFRYGEQLKDGFASQADLVFMLDVGTGTTLPVHATIQARSRARSSASLLDSVYLHQFADGTAGGIPGLVGKPLLAAEGYSGETVWYDPLSPAPFVAKCATSVIPGTPDRCLRTIHLTSGLAVTLGFNATALQDWRRIDEELAVWLAQIGAL
jgi:hypothetical protein